MLARWNALIDVDDNDAAESDTTFYQYEYKYEDEDAFDLCCHVREGPDYLEELEEEERSITVGRACFDTTLNPDSASGTCEYTAESEPTSYFTVAKTVLDRAVGHAVWELGKAVDETNPGYKAMIEEVRHEAEQRIQMLREEVDGLEDIATGCRGCCPRINELASNEMAWDKQVRNSLELLDDTEEPAADDVECPATADFMQKPLWNDPPGSRRIKYPRIPKGRKKWRIRLTRLLRMPADMKYSFRREAQRATQMIIKTLKGKYRTEAELAYKFAIEVREGILHTMENYLKLPETLEAKITKENVAQFVQYSGLLMVFNRHSPNTPVRLCYNPAQKKPGSNETVNSNIAAPKSYVVKLRPVYYRI